MRVDTEIRPVVLVLDVVEDLEGEVVIRCRMGETDSRSLVSREGCGGGGRGGCLVRGSHCGLTSTL